MADLDKYFSAKLDELDSQDLLRTIRNYDGGLVNFSSNDYLGLAQSQRLKRIASEVIGEYGVGSGASRLTTGNSPLYDRLEEEVASLHGKESACVFSSGYSANIGAISALVEKGDLVITDKLSHSCIIEGAKLSGAEFVRFNHNDYDHLKRILERKREDHQNCLIISESVFSMDGDRADVKKLNAIAKEHDSWTYLDYAHDISFPKEKPDIIMGTFSKAFASLGGYICCSETVIKFIKGKAKSLIYSTALPPSVLATSLGAIKIAASNPEKVEAALENAHYFCSLLGIPEPESQIVPLILGEELKAIELSDKLEDKGFIVSAIRPPTVPKGTSRLRFSFSALHSKEQIKELAIFIKEIL